MKARVAFSAIAAVVIYLSAVAVIATLLGWFTPRAWVTGPWALVAQAAPVIIAALAVAAVLVRTEHATWKVMGWRGTRLDAGALAWGVGIGAVMAVGGVAVAMGVGGARVSLTGESAVAWLRAVGRIGCGLAAAALAEELLFRGYPLARLAAGIGKVGASVVLAVLFAGVHLDNPDVPVLGIANIALASLVLSAAFFTPGGMPAAWGVHLGWNAGLAFGADAPVSGLQLRVPGVQFAPGSVRVVTGGAFGPEGGLAATLVMGIALAGLVWWARRAKVRGAT